MPKKNTILNPYFLKKTSTDLSFSRISESFMSLSKQPTWCFILENRSAPLIKDFFKFGDSKEIFILIFFSETGLMICPFLPIKAETLSFENVNPSLLGRLTFKFVFDIILIICKLKSAKVFSIFLALFSGLPSPLID